MSEERYKNFVDDVDNRGEDLAEAMKKEIESIIRKSQNPRVAAEIIFDLILAIRSLPSSHEW